MKMSGCETDPDGFFLSLSDPVVRRFLLLTVVQLLCSEVPARLPGLSRKLLFDRRTVGGKVTLWTRRSGRMSRRLAGSQRRTLTFHGGAVKGLQK